VGREVVWVWGVDRWGGGVGGGGGGGGGGLKNRLEQAQLSPCLSTQLVLVDFSPTTTSQKPMTILITLGPKLRQMKSS